MSIPILATVADVRRAVAAARGGGREVALVPTMGALHEGHAALIRAAKSSSGYVAVSVFVNPTQFGPREDFAEYPRALEADSALAEAAGADLAFAPSVEEMYPLGSATTVEVAGLQDVLCGASRPGHFRGVCTVVLKLFQIVAPDVALFGAKDFQQTRIIARMVRDLDVPVRVRVEPTVREHDGLALSSRNRYLTEEQRRAAPRIYGALLQAQERAAAGERNVPELEGFLRAELSRIPGGALDYARIVDSDSLGSLAVLDRPAVAAVALSLGTTRLIDNAALA